MVTIVTDNGGPFRSFRFEAPKDDGAEAEASGQCFFQTAVATPEGVTVLRLV